MSQKVKMIFECPSCKTEFSAEIFKTLWIEFPENRELVFKNSVNLVTCTGCGSPIKIETPLLCTNIKMNFAVWYDPRHDEHVTEEIRKYVKVLGADTYFATAPRIPDWEDFKSTLLKYEQGVIVNKPLTRPNMDNLINMVAELKNKQSSRVSMWLRNLFK